MTCSITISLRHPGKDLRDEQELIRPKEGKGTFLAEGTAGSKATPEGRRVYSGPYEEQ